MKFWVLLGIVLLLLPVVYAAKTVDVTLKPGESYSLEGKNITLLGSVNGSMMLCINNEKFIVSKDKSISEISIDFRRASYEEAFFKLKYECGKDCQCDGDECSNNACSFGPEELNNISLNETIPDEKEELSSECAKDLDCNDDDICTIDICKDSACKHESILGCSVPLDTQQDTRTDNKTFEYLAYTLLGVVLFLGAFAIFKLSMKKKK